MTPLEDIREIVAAELSRPADDDVRVLAESLGREPGALAVLFYGARRRASEDRGGPLDLYLLTSGDAAHHGWGVSALFNRLLPPNVYRRKEGDAEAKLAVMRLAAFRARMRRESWDTTLWARFSQPVTLVWAKDDAAREAVVDAVAEAVRTAGWWAARLAPEGEDPWKALYSATYGAELRVEQKHGRAGSVVDAAADRFDRLRAPAIAASGSPSVAERKAATRSWERRRRIGKLLNMSRLVKAAFTYSGGPGYLLSKMERHRGRPFDLSPRQRRWPVLALGPAAWRLWREGRLR